MMSSMGWPPPWGHPWVGFGWLEDTHGWGLVGGHLWVGHHGDITHGLGALTSPKMRHPWVGVGWRTPMGGGGLVGGHPWVGRHLGDTHGWGLAGGYPWVVGWVGDVGWRMSGLGRVLVAPGGWALWCHPWVGAPFWRHPWVGVGWRTPMGGGWLEDTHGLATFLGLPMGGHLLGVGVGPRAPMGGHVLWNSHGLATFLETPMGALWPSATHGWASPLGHPWVGHLGATHVRASPWGRATPERPFP